MGAWGLSFIFEQQSTRLLSSWLDRCASSTKVLCTTSPAAAMRVRGSSLTTRIETSSSQPSARPRPDMGGSVTSSACTDRRTQFAQASRSVATLPSAYITTSSKELQIIWAFTSRLSVLSPTAEPHEFENRAPTSPPAQMTIGLPSFSSFVGAVEPSIYYLLARGLGDRHIPHRQTLFSLGSFSDPRNSRLLRLL
jgi:hypothetical protein